MKIVPQKYGDYLAMDVIFMVKDLCSCDEFTSIRLNEIYDHLCSKIDSENRPDIVYDFYDDKNNLLENLVLTSVE